MNGSNISRERPTGAAISGTGAASGSGLLPAQSSTGPSRRRPSPHASLPERSGWQRQTAPRMISFAPRNPLSGSEPAPSGRADHAAGASPSYHPGPASYWPDPSESGELGVMLAQGMRISSARGKSRLGDSSLARTAGGNPAPHDSRGIHVGAAPAASPGVAIPSPRTTFSPANSHPIHSYTEQDDLLHLAQFQRDVLSGKDRTPVAITLRGINEAHLKDVMRTSVQRRDMAIMYNFIPPGSLSAGLTHEQLVTAASAFRKAMSDNAAADSRHTQAEAESSASGRYRKPSLDNYIQDPIHTAYAAIGGGAAIPRATFEKYFSQHGLTDLGRAELDHPPKPGSM